MQRLATISIVSLTAVLGACATTGDDGAVDEQDSTATQYVQIQDFNSAEDAWYGITATLNGQFDQVCGDTFCEGDFSNLTPLRLFCSVTSKIGNVHDCAWTFTASTHEVDTRTANVAVEAVTYQCHFKPKTTGPKLIAMLAGAADPLHLQLSGMTSIYDVLGDCFAHPIGATPITVSAPGSTYVDAADYYTTPANSARWTASTQALHEGFDQVCGDTFCGSDYSDVQALDLGCSVTKSTGNVKACVWNFGGSYTTIKKNGDLDLVSTTWSCPVAVHGTISQLITVLTSTGDPSDPIQRPLPGGTSAYDSIAGCVTR